VRTKSFKHGYVSGFLVGVGLGILTFRHWYGIIPLLISIFLHGPSTHMTRSEVQELDLKFAAKEDTE